MGKISRNLGLKDKAVGACREGCMGEYIIYTPEGETVAPNIDCPVENCQVLGCASGNSSEEAIATLLNENPWIIDAGFDEHEFIIRQLA
jgi:hypothetical protein